jgi:hypothetical protein
MRNRYPNVRGETYSGLCQIEDPANVPPTAGAARSDLVVARVEDSQFAGQAPGAPRTEVITNVPAGTTRFVQLGRAYPAIELSRLDIPANTAAITAAMIVDLRRLAQPHQSRELMSQAAPQPIILTSPGWTRWPNWNPVVEIPWWATHVNALIMLQSIGGGGAPTRGELRGRVAGAGDVTIQASWASLFEFSDAGRWSFAQTVGGFIPPQFRGLPATFSLEGHIDEAFGAGRIGTNPGSAMAYDVQFSEQAV